MATKNNTKQKGSFILYAVIFIAVIFIIYQVVINRKPKDEKETAVQETQTGNSTAAAAPSTSGTNSYEPTAPAFNANKVLKKGSSGTEVQYLQQALNRVRVLKKLQPISVDGKFGPQTETSVANFMGSKTTTYAKVKAAVIATFKAAGKGNPYDIETGDDESEGFSWTNVFGGGF